METFSTKRAKSAFFYILKNSAVSIYSHMCIVLVMVVESHYQSASVMVLSSVIVLFFRKHNMNQFFVYFAV